MRPIAALALLTASFVCLRSTAGETLYNGIELPAVWPPKPAEYLSAEAAPPPYLKTPPAVIPIDVGRQLFVDDFLIAETTLTRVFHLAEFHKDCPVLKPEADWEKVRGQPFAAPFSDGIAWDPKDGCLKLWYMSGNGYATSYATSRDGIRWERPVVKPSNRDGNELLIDPYGRDSGAVWLDVDAQDPAQRYKMTRYRAGVEFRTSADGIAWSEAKRLPKRFWNDRTTFFYNPFRKVWVVSGRMHDRGRVRAYQERPDFDFSSVDAEQTYAKWMRADDLDKVRPGPFGKDLPDLYNLDCVPYESLMLGMFTIHAADAGEDGRPKLNYVTLGFSRDGFYWSRPDRRAFMGLSEDRAAWNWGNVQSALGLIVMGEKLYFYCSGRNSHREKQDDGSGGSMGLAVLRRDGFASMDGTGTLTTRTVTFKGARLFVNAECAGGELRAEALGENGQPIAGCTKDACVPLKSDGTLQEVTWKGGDLAQAAGAKVRFRFHLTNGKLYAFWVSPDASGASYGYAGTGGPGFTSHRDTVGRAAYERKP